MVLDKSWRCGLVAALLIIPSTAVLAAATEEESSLAQEDRIGELERKVEVLTEELERTRTDMAVPESKLESVFGLGPAASKVYGLTRGLSLGGYAEGLYTGVVKDKRDSGEVNRIDMLRAVLYTGYKFTDHIVWNSEIEFEHATTSSTESSGSGSVSVEFAALDFLALDELNARVGLVLVPMGFVNEIHEPPFYLGANRPEVERVIIPSTWRENGVGIFGQLAGERLSYRFYTVNGFNAKGFNAGGWRGGRQQGNRALAEDMAFVGRVDYSPLDWLLVGGSVYVGDSGQDQTTNGVDLPDALTTMWEVHTQLRALGLQVRGLLTMAHLDEAGALTRALGPVALGGSGKLDTNNNGIIDTGEVVARRMFGAYGEISYEVLQWITPESEMTLEPFFRAEWIDTQDDMPDGFAADRRKELEIYTAGLHFRPISQVVIKLDYRNKRAEQGAAGDEINAGIGLVF
jgi:hypothetical protein